MRKIPLTIQEKTVTSKVDPAAWERLKRLAEDNGARMQDVLSIMLAFCPEELVVEKLKECAAEVGALAKPVRNLIKNLPNLSDQERAILRDALGE